MRIFPYSIYLFIIVSGFVMGLFSYKKNIKLRPVTILLGVTFISETSGFILQNFQLDSMPVYHVFNVIQLLLWAVFFYRNLNNGIVKKNIPWTAGFMFLFSVFNTLFLQGLFEFPDNFINLESLILIFWAITLFNQQLEIPSRENIFTNAIFIISVAVLWFNLFSFLYFLLFNYFMKRHISKGYIIYIHYFSNLIFYLLLFWANLLSYLYYRYAAKNK